MTIRTKRETVTFERPFSLKGFGRTLPAGVYEVLTDEELIEGLSLPVYRRVSTMIFVPAESPSSAIETLTVDAHDLAAAVRRDLLYGYTTETTSPRVR
jgi:hypothetical protein